MAENSPIRLTDSDLRSEQVESYIQEQQARARAMPDIPTQPLILRVVYANWFYLGLAGALGAFLAWATLEPLVSDAEDESMLGAFVSYFMFAPVAAMVGLFIGAAEGVMSRNLLRALVSALVGFGIGLVGGLIASIIGNILYGVFGLFAYSISPPTTPESVPQGWGLLILMSGRAVAWAIVAITAGLGQGIAIRERKVVFNGMIGAVMGGLFGGLLFDPVWLLLGQPEEAHVSRAIGITLIGLFVGVFIGLVESWTKTAWLLMRAGSLAGKQFVLYKNPTVIGSAPKADIYIFKDPAIEPRHALLHNRGGRYELEDLNTPDGTYVNGVPVTRQVLKSGDQIVMGKTVLEFTLKEAR